MTRKYIKTILFTSLIAAMILPFSALSLADAAPNQNASDKAKKTHAEHIAEGKIVAPGGHYVLPEDVIRIKANESIEEHAQRGIDPSILTHRDGKTMVDIDKVRAKYLKDQLKGDSSNEEINLPDSDGYNTIVIKHDDDSMTYFRAFWDVPTSPSEYDDGTIYIFNGMQPHYPETPIAIFQPIIQYGNHGVCGNIGENWEMAPVLFVAPSTIVIGDCMSVSENDQIRGTISKSGSTWTIEVLSGSDSDSVLASYAGQADLSSLALETYALDDTSCDEVQGDIEFSSMSITGDSVEWEDDTDPQLQWCGMDSNIISDSAVELNNDN